MQTRISEGADSFDFVGTLARATGRRSFLRWTGLTIGVMAINGCGSNSTDLVADSVDLGAGDTGVLNYAYALEQLEAAFYTQVIATPYGGITAAETTILTDIRDHEVIHRNFLKAALGTSAIKDLAVSFSGITFTSRASVLAAAKTFEDLGVSAYNYAGQLLADPGNLLVAGKIVSVEARHASVIRDLINPESADFAGDDVVNTTTGLDVSNAPGVVLAENAAGAYVTTAITFGNLPTS